MAKRRYNGGNKKRLSNVERRMADDLQGDDETDHRESDNRYA